MTEAFARAGIDLISSVHAPPPEHLPAGEWGRRLVRHGMAEILEWLGEEVGPSPDEMVHTTYLISGTAVAHPDTIAKIKASL